MRKAFGRRGRQELSRPGATVGRCTPLPCPVYTKCCTVSAGENAATKALRPPYYHCHPIETADSTKDARITSLLHWHTLRAFTGSSVHWESERSLGEHQSSRMWTRGYATTFLDPFN